MATATENIRARGEQLRKNADARREQARKEIDPKYHAFIIDLDQKVKIADFEAEPLKNVPGFAVYGGKTYAETSLPYVAVDGRVRMATDEHRKAEKKMSVQFATEWVRAAADLDIEAIKLLPEDLKNILTATVTSEIYGTFEGSAKIAWTGGGGVDRTNPYENSQTSALGRALGNMGYGLLGGGIASYDEVKAAVEERERIEQPAPATPKTTTPAPAPKPATPTTPPADPITNGPTPPQPAAAPQPAPAPNNDDPALTQDGGNCADCGQPVNEVDVKQKAIATFIRNRRKAGDKLRWTHAAVKGGEKFCKPE